MSPVRKFGEWCRSCAVRQDIGSGLCKVCEDVVRWGYSPGPVEAEVIRPLSRQEFDREVWAMIEREQAS